MDRKYSDPTIWDNSIDHDDEPDGSDGGYTKHGSFIVAPAMRELVRLRAELETERMRLVMKAPITFEVACKAWGDVPSLCDDSVRKCFFAVWALLCFEWAEAMVEHAQSRKVGAGMARNPLRDAAIDAALAAKGEKNDV